jgi:hypothetical protein
MKFCILKNNYFAALKSLSKVTKGLKKMLLLLNLNDIIDKVKKFIYYHPFLRRYILGIILIILLIYIINPSQDTINAIILIVYNRNIILNKKIKYNYISKRYMWSTGKKILNLYPKNIINRKMSVYSLHKPEKVPKDPDAIKKNPPIGKNGMRHGEIRRTKCIEKNCENKICPLGKPCNTIKDHKTIANTTHSNNDTQYGKNHELDPNVDYNGNLKKQNAIFYKKSHDANQTKEISDGTTFLKKPNVIKEIKKYEDKS